MTTAANTNERNPKCRANIFKRMLFRFGFEFRFEFEIVEKGKLPIIYRSTIGATTVRSEESERKHILRERSTILTFKQ